MKLKLNKASNLLKMHESASRTSFANAFETRAISSPSCLAISASTSPDLWPSALRRRDCSIRSLKDLEDVPLQRIPVLGPLHASPQLLGDDDTEMLKRGKKTMELLEFLVENRIAKGVDKKLSIEEAELARGSSHRSASGGAWILIPSHLRVPDINAAVRRITAKGGGPERADGGA